MIKVESVLHDYLGVLRSLSDIALHSNPEIVGSNPTRTNFVCLNYHAIMLTSWVLFNGYHCLSCVEGKSIEKIAGITTALAYMYNFRGHY